MNVSCSPEVSARYYLCVTFVYAYQNLFFNFVFNKLVNTIQVLSLGRIWPVAVPIYRFILITIHFMLFIYSFIHNISKILKNINNGKHEYLQL